jgi:integrase
MTKTPWNKNKAVGQKKAFTPKQLEMIREFLANQGKLMEITLLNLGVDTMLRYSDLSKLKVEDVLDWNDNVKSEINLKQKKTKHSHMVTLSDKTKRCLKEWIKQSKKSGEDYIFTARTRGEAYKKSKISRTTYTDYIKEWAKYLHLDPANYASHTLRRTKAAFLYDKGISIEVIRVLLGQKSIESTKEYLGIEREEAFEINRKYEL